MLNQQNDRFIQNALLHLQPDVFMHPLWMGFSTENITPSNTLCHELSLTAQNLQSIGDVQSACQVLFVCAALQKQYGDQDAALNSIQQAWTLAEQYGIPQISIWAAWGASAVCYVLDDEQRTGNYLEWLQQKLTEEGDWVTANIVNLMKRTVLHQTQERAGIRVSLGWLRRWGESPSFLSVRGRISAVDQIPFKGRPFTEIISFEVIGMFRSFWRAIKRIASVKMYLRWVKREEPSLVTAPPKDQTRGALSPTTLLPGMMNSSPQPGLQRDNPSPGYPPLQIEPVLGIEKKTLPGYLDPVCPEPSLVVYCLGPFRTYRNGTLIENWSSKKGQLIFKYLVTHRTSLMRKDFLMDVFWPDADLEAARRNLHQAIYALRQTLNLEGSDFQYIQFWNDCYRLNPELHVWVDYEEFEKHVKTGQRLEESNAIEEAAAEYGIAEALYQNDFLIDDLYEDWCQSQRRYLWQTYLSIALRLARYYLEHGEHAATIALCRRLLNQDNCQEEAHRYLIRCYLEQGQRHLALSQYQLCARSLQDELGLEPSAEIQELYRKITGEFVK